MSVSESPYRTFSSSRFVDGRTLNVEPSECSRISWGRCLSCHGARGGIHLTFRNVNACSEDVTCTEILI